MKIVCKSNNQSFENMKRSVFSLMIVCACAFLLSAVFESKAQTGYTYTAWRETDVLPNGQPAPLDFMTLGDQNHKYVRCRYGNNGRDYKTNNGVTSTSDLVSSHKLITRTGTYANNPPDPCRCYQNGSTYTHEKFFPQSWDGVPGHELDKIIRLGCYGSHGTGTPCMQSQEIEYWFYPPKDSSVLLVYFTFAEEDVEWHNTKENPKFFIEILDGTNSNTETLVPSDCYKNRQVYGPDPDCSPTGTPNQNWPYNRFLASPSGEDYSQEHYCGPDAETGIYTYYWPQESTEYGTTYYTYSTPTTFPYWECPTNQTSSYAQQPVKWFQYTPVAFDLSNYADQNKAVRLRVRAAACEYEAHWAYGMFAAKLIPGKIKVDACGDEPITLSVPWGFIPNSYQWRCGSDAQHANKLVEIGDPGVEGTMTNLVLNPAAPNAKVYPYYCCEMMSHTGVPFTYEAYIKKYLIEPDFTYEQITNPDYPCSHIIQLHNTGQVSELTPKLTGVGYDTLPQTPIRCTEWYYKNSAGEYREIPGSRGQLNPVFNITNTADINLNNFNYGPNGDSIMIKFILQDSLQKCIDSVVMNIALDPTFVKVGTKDTTVFACNSQLPYFFGRDKYGDAYRWDTQGKKDCHVGEDFGDDSWNYCDSVVSVTLEVMTPRVEIVDMGDYCDSFRTTLTVVPAPNQVFNQEDIHVLSWNGDEYATGTHYLAEHAGAYSVDVSIGEEGCMTSASYKIAACMPFMNLPNTITPSNHDGVNDYFEIPQKSLVQSLEFTVYNRNGTVVYQTKDVNFKWRGARFSDDYPEQELTNQTYVYTLKMVDYNGKPYPVIKGVIVVL